MNVFMAINFWFLNPLKFLSCTHTLHVLAIIMIIWFIFIILANIFPITCTVNKGPKGYTSIIYYHYTIYFLKMSSNLHYNSEVIPHIYCFNRQSFRFWSENLHILHQVRKRNLNDWMILACRSLKFSTKPETYIFI